jgi:hypothetical protein
MNCDNGITEELSGSGAVARLNNMVDQREGKKSQRGGCIEWTITEASTTLRKMEDWVESIDQYIYSVLKRMNEPDPRAPYVPLN